MLLDLDRPLRLRHSLHLPGVRWLAVAAFFFVGMTGCTEADRATGPDSDLPAADPPLTGFEERGGADWTSHEEEIIFLTEVAAGSPRVRVTEIGRSVQGRPIHVVRVGHPVPPTDAQIAGGRSLLVIGAQHGNEPAGREMALQLLRDLAWTGDLELIGYLEESTVLFIPSANPDGREANSRRNAHGVDSNRDHLRLLTLEARAMARVMRDFTPDIVVDAHERGGMNPEMELLWPRNLNIFAPVRDHSRELVEDFLFPDLAAAGWTTGLYEPAPGPPGDENEHTLRNAGGLRHSLGLLTETARQRPPVERVEAQMETMWSVIRFHRERSGAIAQAVTSAPLAKAFAGAERTEPFFLGGADNDPPSSDQLLDPPPCGYLMHAEQSAALSRQVELLPLRFEVVSASGVFFPMDQPLMTVVPLLADPRARGNLVSALPLTSGAECADPGSVEPPEPPPSTGPAQHVADFGRSTTDGLPEGWSVRWRESGWRVKGTPPIVRHQVGAVAGRRALAWNEPGGEGIVHGEVEVFAVVRVPDPMPQTRFQLAVHLSGETNAENAFYLDARSDGSVRLNRYQGGSFGTLASAPLPFTLEAGAWYEVVLRYRDQLLSGKVWPEGEPEPEGWQVEAVSTLLGSGRVGLAHFSPGAVNEWGWVSVGTGGEPAPRRP